MERFLTAKHWQIFILTFGLPFMIEIIAMPFMIFGNNPMMVVKIMPLIMILFLAGYFGWFWAIAVNLQRILPDDLKLSTAKFKIFMLLPVIYILIFFVFLDSAINGSFENESSTFPAMFALIFPLHLFSMFCIFYCLYFVAKVFKTAELERKVTFSDFAGEFFLIWFFPVGIWIIQPKINKMLESKGR